MIQNWTDAGKETFTFNSHQSEQEFLFSFKNLNSSFVVIKKSSLQSWYFGQKNI
jgi:hypothetical protein